MPLKYSCHICKMKFSSRVELDSHRLSKHDMIFIPFTKEEVGRLYQFLYTRDVSLLTRNMIETITKYNKSILSKRFQIEPE